MTVSHWRRTTALGTIETHAAVVGAGIAGVSAALHLQDLGIPAVVLERHAVGSGASTRNAGFLMRGAADNYAIARKQYGPDTARTLWRWTEENLALLGTRGIHTLPSFAPRPSCLLALEPNERAELGQSHALLQQDGFDSRWLEPGSGPADAVWASGKPLAALLNPHDAVVNPHELLTHLRAQFRGPVHELQELAEISHKDSSTLELRTPDALIRCRGALLCLNAYTPLLLPSLAPFIEPNRGQMLALHAPESELPLRYAYYANRGSEYFRRADPETVVVGGRRTHHAESERTYDDRHSPAVQNDLEDFAESLFARRFPVKARWAGTMGFTPDHLPLIGPLPGFEGKAWICAGFTGHGMSLAHRATRCAVELMTQRGSENNPFPLSRFNPA